ncbi:MAG: pyridoxal phosphate-dependent aminotransferase [Candidatus Eremiobacteraeota bacterium]|nr:pyridoxal phosphate-dependent aminotransferase [Candidatus Eremiobacteraeota bacterium]
MIAERIKELEESMTLAITAKAKAMKAQGEKVIIMASGEPDFDTPQNIKDAAVQAIAQGFTKYTATSGIDELKEALCEKFRHENRIEYTKKNVIVTCGGKQALYNAIQATINSGDEVIIPSPYWVSYVEQVKLAGGKPVILNTGVTGFDLEKLKGALTPRTRMLIINSPNNPTGAVLERATIEGIAALALERKFLVISDEVYERFIYGSGIHHSIASLGPEMKELTITINAFSKTYSMTGWRVGYAAAPEAIIKAMGMVQDHQTSNTSSISQKAALEALKGSQDSVTVMVREFEKRRNYMVERLNAIEGIECPLPPGAFYTFPRVAALYHEKLNGSFAFAERLLEEMKVALIPGVGFGSDEHVRLTYSASLEDIREGMDRIAEFVSLQRSPR